MLARLRPMPNPCAVEVGPDDDAEFMADTDNLRVPTLTAPHTWRFVGVGVLPVMVSRVAPSPHPLRLEREDGSELVTFPAGAQSWCQLSAHAGRWEVVGGVVAGAEVGG